MKKSMIYVGLGIILFLFINPNHSFGQENPGPSDRILKCGQKGLFYKKYKSKHCYGVEEFGNTVAATRQFKKDLLRLVSCVNTCGPGVDPCKPEFVNFTHGQLFANGVKSCSKDSIAFRWKCTQCDERDNNATPSESAKLESEQPSKYTSERTQGLALQIAPNPSTGRFNFFLNTTSNYEQLQLKIVNLFGQEVFSKQYDIQNRNTLQLEIDLSHVPNGAYLASIYHKDMLIETQRLLLKK